MIWLPALLMLYTIIRSYASCLSDEFSFQNSACPKCKVFIPHCAACTSGEYLEITNGSFEEPIITGVWFYFNPIGAVPGWTANADGWIEINTDPPAYDGNQILQTAAIQNDIIHQYVTTEVNQIYQLEFYFSGYPGFNTRQNRVINTFGGASKTITTDSTGESSTVWVKHTLRMVATQTSSKIEFAGAGIGNGFLGPHIDSVVYKNMPTCTECDTSYALYDNHCILCSSIFHNCTECSINACTTCEEGYYLENGKCKICSDFCRKCSASEYCEECEDTFVLSDNICVCDEYFLVQNGLCKYHPLTYTFTNITESEYQIEFSEDVLPILSSSNLRSYFVPNNQEFEFEVESVSLFRYILRINENINNSTGFQVDLIDVKGSSGAIVLEKSIDFAFSQEEPTEDMQDEKEDTPDGEEDVSNERS